MPPRPPVTLTLTVLSLPPLIYALHLQQRLQPTSRLPIQVSNTIPTSLATSRTITTLVNPADHVAGTDTRSILLPASQVLRDAKSGKPRSDQEVLDRFVSGIWAGRVFAPERWALGLVRWIGVRSFLGIRGVEAGKGQEVWREAEIRAVREWGVGMRVSGAFQVVDRGVTERLQEATFYEGTKGEDDTAGTGRRERETYVDFVFGSDTGFLRGVHRFSVLSRPSTDADGKGEEGGQEELELRFAALACDPTRNEPLKPAWLATFHLMYAKLLFRDGVVAAVLASERG